MSKSPLLSEKTFSKVLNRKAFGPDSIIFRQGETGRDAFVVLRGQVEIVTKSQSGKFTQLAAIKEGEMFGEMSLLNNAKRSAHAVTKEGCELLVIDQETLDKKLKDADPFVRYWIEFLTTRVLDISKRVTG